MFINIIIQHCVSNCVRCYFISKDIHKRFVFDLFSFKKQINFIVLNITVFENPIDQRLCSIRHEIIQII